MNNFGTTFTVVDSVCVLPLSIGSTSLKIPLACRTGNPEVARSTLVLPLADDKTK